MGVWGGSDPEEVETTALEIEQLRQAELQYEDRKAFDPVKNMFQGNPGDPTGGLMSQNFSGYGENRAAGESAQTTNRAREEMGPLNMSSGSGQKALAGLSSARGTGAAGGMGEAIWKGAVGVRERQLNALGSELGLAANISQTTNTAAQESSERARLLAQNELEMSISENAGKAQLVSDMSSAYMKGAQMTGNEANPFKWKEKWGEMNPYSNSG